MTSLPLHSEFFPGHVIQRFTQRGQFGLQITAQHNVSAASRHIGGDGHDPRPARLGNNLCLLLVILGIEHLMLNILLLKSLGQLLRRFN